MAVFGKTKKGNFYLKREGIVSNLPPTNTAGIPMQEHAPTSPLEFVGKQSQKFLNRIKGKNTVAEVENEDLIEQLQEKQETLENIEEAIDSGIIQKSIQKSETNPQDVNLTDVPSSSIVEEQENKKVETLQHNEKLTEISGKIIDKFNEQAAEVIETLQADEEELEKDTKKLEKAKDKGEEKEIKEEIKDDEKVIKEDKKAVKEVIKEEKKIEKEIIKKVKDTVRDLINEPAAPSAPAGRTEQKAATVKKHEFTEKDRKNFQSPSFRETLLLFEGGPEILAAAKAQGLYS